TIVVFAARPLPSLQAAEAGVLAMAGGLLQTLLSVALWPIRRHEPERRIVAALYKALAEVARRPTPPSSTPPNSDQFSDAQDALASLSGDHSVDGERIVFLLNQAERIRLSLLNLGRVFRRLGRDAHGGAAADALLQVLQNAALALDSIAEGVTEGKINGNIRPFQDALQQFLAQDHGAYTTFFAALLRDARQQLDALGGQLRAATSSAAAAVSRKDDKEPWRLRFTGRLAKLQANMSLHSTIFRHALRLAVCVGLGDAVGRGIQVQRTYWIPMTIAIVLKPDFTATVSRGILRLAGTFAGLVFATALFHFVHAGLQTDIVLLAGFIFLLRWIGPANYGIFVTALSSMVVLLIALTGVAPKEVISSRAINTGIGGVLAMIAYAAWPTWERTLVGPALADMMENYRAYFRAVIDAYGDGPVSAIDSTRVKGRRARSNAEASVDRLSAEPGITQEQVNTLNAMLVNSHSFVHAVMALESGLYQTRKVPPREATGQFASKVEQTLTALARGLRDRSGLPGDLPDLREAHTAILQSRKAGTDRYTLVNIETDRITTSLNTLAEQVRKWLALSHPKGTPPLSL
ncbi:MAG: FUSC family protein, partial [Acidobacteriota bacterium]